MQRWLLAIIALIATVASAERITTLSWDNGANWPTGTTVELCANDLCVPGLTGTQHTMTVPVQPGGVISAKARAVTPSGYQCGSPSVPCPYSAWGTLVQTWPETPINGWAIYEEGQTMAVEQVGSSYLSSIYTESLAVTVPSDAQLAIIYGKDYADPTGTPLLGTASSTLILKHTNTGIRPLIGMYYVLSPPVGAQTLYFNSARGFSDPYYYGVAFYKGVNTLSPISSSNLTTGSVDITGLTAPAGSMMFGVAGGSYAVPTVTDNGQTQLQLENTHGFAVAQLANATGFYFTGSALNAIAITINPSAVANSLPPMLSAAYSSILVR